jgi:hypothetical protein
VLDAAAVTEVAAGESRTLLLFADGTVWRTGPVPDCQSGGDWSSFGPLDGLSDVVSVATSIALTADGLVWTWGEIASSAGCDPSPVSGFSAADQSWLEADSDGDGLTNRQEVTWSTDPVNPDTNGDGISDGASVAMGISPTALDHDGDGVPNALELKRGTDPFKADTDGDGVNDGADCFPLDPTQSLCPSPDPNDHTPPGITLWEPPTAVPVP